MSENPGPVLIRSGVDDIDQTNTPIPATMSTMTTPISPKISPYGAPLRVGPGGKETPNGGAL